MKYQNRLLILGPARNCKNYINTSLHQLASLGRQFKEYRIIVYENDSVDGTFEELVRFGSKNKNFALLTANNVNGKRTQRIAHARNALLRAMPHFQKNDLVLMADLDQVNLEIEGFEHAMKFIQQNSSVCVFPNQKTHYYDIFALSTFEVDNCNVFNCKFFHWLYHLPVTKTPVQIKSAFGGLGLYPRWLIQNKVYNGDHGCEHIFFNLSLNADLFIVPNWINSGYDENFNLIQALIGVVVVLVFLLYVQIAPPATKGTY